MTGITHPFVSGVSGDLLSIGAWHHGRRHGTGDAPDPHSACSACSLV